MLPKKINAALIRTFGRTKIQQLGLRPGRESPITFVISYLPSLRAEAGVIDNVPLDNPLRMEFNRLHLWSERFEQAVFLLGLAALFLTARALH